MKKYLFLVCAICATLSSPKSFAQGWQWAAGVPYAAALPGNSEGWIAKADHSNNVYTCGQFEDSLFIGTASYFDTDAVLGHFEVFLVKNDSLGNYLWSAAPSAPSSPLGVTVGPDNSVYLFGIYYSDSIMFSATKLVRADTLAYHYFLVKYDSSGNVIWGKTLAGNNGGFSGMVFGGIDCDEWGNLYIMSQYEVAGFQIGAFTLTHPSFYNDLFLAKLDSSGNVLWANGYGGAYDNQPIAISVSKANHIYITGFFSSPVIRFSPVDSVVSTTNGSSAENTFLVKFDTSGHVLWARSPVNSCQSNCLTTDKFDDAIIGGYQIDDSVIFGSDTITNPYSSMFDFGAYLAKYDSSGHALWARSFYSPTGITQVYAVATDTCNNVYGVGGWGSLHLYNNLTLDSATTVPPPASCVDPMFLVKMDPTGNLAYNEEFVSGGEDFVGLASDYNGNLILTGDYQDNFTLGTTTLLPGRGEELYFAGKYDVGTCMFSLAAPTAAVLTTTSIFPNPAINEINISAPFVISHISISNILGQEVPVPGFSSSPDVTLDVQSLRPGIYFVKINGMEVRKFIKE